jgi:hypothetical protein
MRRPSRAHRVKPGFAVEVRFRKSPDKLRQPVFVHVRDDKPPRNACCVPRGMSPGPSKCRRAGQRREAHSLHESRQVFWRGLPWAGLIDYYRAVAWLLPYLRDQPLK